MDFLDDPAVMTPDQRLAEVIAILLRGLARLTEKRLDLGAPDRPPWATGGAR